MKDRYIDLDEHNLEAHHLCCALGDRKHEPGVAAKKAWLKRRFREGLVFRKLDVRGKVFIEYAPAEVAWRPVVAPGWLVIHCLWVSGQYAGQGHGRHLLTSCMDDARAQGKAGVVVAAAKRKRPFLSDARFFKHFGFEVLDTAGEFLLLGWVLDPDAQTPRFADAVHKGEGQRDAPFRARFSDQCPLNAHWSEEMADGIRARGFDVGVEHLTTRRRAQRVASPLGAFGLERDGVLVTHHLNTVGATQRLLDRLP